MAHRDGSSGPLLGTTSARLVAVRLKSANKHIFRALLNLASANLLIRVMGMLTQIIVTARFGQGATMDAYFVASTMPILLAQLLSSALEASVIPVYTRLRTKGTREQASRLFSTLLNLLLIALTLCIVGMLIFRRQMVIFSAPALPSSSLELAIRLTPYIFPILIFIVINSYLECLLNTEGQFGWPAYAGVLAPLTAATLILYTAQSYGVVMLCVGTIAGQCLQLLAILLRARRSKLVYRFVLDLHSPEIAAIGIVAWPALFSALISQASPLIDQMFASSLSEGSIAALNNALKLISVPIGVIFTSVGRAALPYLARQAAIKDMHAFKGTLRLYLWMVGAGTIVLTIIMIIFARPLVQVIFQHGAFTADATEQTALTLIGFTPGLTPMAFGFITSRAFSALGQTRILMYITIFSVVANAGFDYIFGHLWQSFGIAIATSAVYFCTMFILLFTLRHLIGKLSFFTPPREIQDALQKLKKGPYYVQWASWVEKRRRTFQYELSRYVPRALFALLALAIGVVGTAYSSLMTLRITSGSLVLLAFLRYRYALLLTWIAVDALIGSTIPFFSGNNFLSGLTLPTLLLMSVMPVKTAFKRMAALPILFAYLLWVFLSIGISPISVTQFLTLWLVYIAYVAIGVLVINLANTKKLLLGLVDAILLQALFIAVYGIYGYFSKQYGLYDANVPSLYRIGSVFAAPPTLAFFLSMIIPLSLYRTLTLKGAQRFFSGIGTLIFLITLILTFTRGAFISITISILIMIALLPSRKLKTALFGVIGVLSGLLVLLATLTGLPIFSRFLSQDVTTLNGRTLLWQALLDHFNPVQLLGNGLDASDVLLTRLQVGIGRGVIGTAPHNIFIGTLYDHGIIGVTLIALLLITLPWTLLARMHNARPDHRLILAMALAIYINVLIQSMEVTVVWNQQIGVYVWIIMALPFALCWDNVQRPYPGDTKTPVKQKESMHA